MTNGFQFGEKIEKYFIPNRVIRETRRSDASHFSEFYKQNLAYRGGNPVLINY